MVFPHLWKLKMGAHSLSAQQWIHLFVPSSPPVTGGTRRRSTRPTSRGRRRSPGNGATPKERWGMSEWWLKMIEDDWRWLKMIEDDWRWLKMIEDDWRWLKMIEDDWRWLKMIEDDWRWLKMIEDDWRWLKMIEDVQKPQVDWFWKWLPLPFGTILDWTRWNGATQKRWLTQVWGNRKQKHYSCSNDYESAYGEMSQHLNAAEKHAPNIGSFPK